MRIVAWNVERLRTRIADLPRAVDELGSPDVLCLQELGMRAEDAAELERALPGYTCHSSLPRDPHNVTYRGGRAYGVATFTRQPSRGVVPPWDREGRVVLARVDDLTIINLSAVNGTSKPYFDEHGRPRGDRHAFKREFQRQLVELGHAMTTEGGVVMAGDWNVTPTAKDTHPRLRTEGPHAHARAELAALFVEHGFVDIWRHLHPDARAYTWFNPRSRSLDAARVDYVMVSRDVVARVKAASILERHAWSDHAPISIELELP
jgi:exodeoxyribonuclease-3